MATAQSQYLRLFDAAGTVYQRWQSYYGNAAVTWDSHSWIYVAFIAEGFTAGLSGEESDVSISAPASQLVVEAFDLARKDGHLAELKIYEFNPAINNNTPQDGQTLIGSYVGQVIGGNAGLTRLTLQLGSALATVGAQLPPRKFTTAMMGQGCRL
jgi:hypothetical protein